MTQSVISSSVPLTLQVKTCVASFVFPILLFGNSIACLVQLSLKASCAIAQGFISVNTITAILLLEKKVEQKLVKLNKVLSHLMPILPVANLMPILCQNFLIPLCLCLIVFVI